MMLVLLFETQFLSGKIPCIWVDKLQVLSIRKTPLSAATEEGA